jgi:hypothetical protein
VGVVLPFFLGFFLNLKSKKNASCFRAATEKAKKEKAKKEKKEKKEKECRLWISRRKAKWLVVR